MPDSVPPDQEERERIASDLSSTLFVEAGAGSGKTAALVTRVLALVTSGEVELANIAAITFTEKAATELRDRIRSRLEGVLGADPHGALADHVPLALEQLDGAAIGTLHSFAQRILSEHPVEAGLPPRVEVIDEVSSEVEFEKRWAAFRDGLLADESLERTILLLVASGVRFEGLRMVAVAFNENWDLVAERVPDSAPDPPDLRALLEPVLSEIETLCAEPCHEPDDSLRINLDAIADYAAELRAIPDELDLLERLGDQGARKPPGFKVGNKGRQAAWGDVGLRDLRDRVRGAGEQLEDVRGKVANACVEQIASALKAFTLDAAEERRKAGQLEFHDLLVRARTVLRDPHHGPDVRARLHARYRRLLLDEFQDTDPIQIELAVLIAAEDPELASTSAFDWAGIAVTPGHLFFVGDPKQSIYRFRRADISTFLAASRRFGEPAGRVELTANFRSVAPLIERVNAVFGRLIEETVTEGVPSQPHYLPLEADRPAPPEGPPLAIVGPLAHPKGATADQLREAEATDVAATVARVVRERWSVGDGDHGWRPARLGDITILVPARTSLPFLEDALDQLGIPYRAESSSLVYSSRAVRDLLMVLRAIADPTNNLHVVSALRTPLFACGDDDLFRFHERRGRWSYLADQPDTVPEDDPVRAGLAYLRGLYEDRYWLAPSELLDRIVRDRRAMDLGFAEGRPRDVWRRLRFVVDQARAWNEATGGNLRQYLSWVALQTAEGARVAEAVLPETDDDAVRILTIHGAKGLEFPITILSGMSTMPQARPRVAAEVVFPPGGKVGYRVGRLAKTPEYTEFAPIDEQMGYHERIRLLYVACTRARDHLVVSLHRKVVASDPSPERRTNAELVLAGLEDVLDEVPDVGEHAGAVAPPEVVAPPPLLPRDEWEAELNGALARAARPTTVSASSLTEEGEPDVEEEPAEAGLQKGPRDLDLPPWLKGRYGTAVGRAVHGVLQTIDLATGEGLDETVQAQCEAEAVVDRAGDVRRLVRDALGCATVREAAASRHWREVYVCAPVGDRQLEGYIDLLYRSPEGLVVVDYKTSATSDPEELARRVDGYRVQGASYARSVAAAAEEPVVRVTFAFLTPDGARERDLPDLAAAIADVGELVGG